MRSVTPQRNHTSTEFIRLDTRNCKACWKCLEACSNKVIGRINMPWHKHAKIVNGSNCTGCLKCIKVCESSALSKISIN